MNDALTTILIVEDSPEILELLEFSLDGRGYNLVPTSTVEGALAAWARFEGRIDLLLTDLRLGRSGSGLELAERLLSLKPSLRVLMVSGCFSDKELTLSGKRIELLSKPFKLTQVAERVKTLLQEDEPASHDFLDPNSRSTVQAGTFDPGIRVQQPQVTDYEPASATRRRLVSSRIASLEIAFCHPRMWSYS